MSQRAATNHQPPTTNHQPPTTNHQPPGEAARGESPLLTALKQAGEGDLAAIQARIEDCEKELEMLRLAEKIIDRRLHGRAKKTAAARFNRDELADRMFRVIQANGPGKPGDIGNKLQVGPILIGKVAAARPDLFQRQEDGRIKLR